MEKTLLRPFLKRKTNLIEVERANEHPDLGQLTDEMKPFLDAASQQLVKPDTEMIERLVQQLSGKLEHGDLR